MKEGLFFAIDLSSVMAGEMWELVNTPLGAAILEDDFDRFKSLLQRGANPKLQDRVSVWILPLRFESHQDMCSAFKFPFYLFQKGNTYLHLIATTHSPKVIHSLVSTGIDVQAQNRVSYLKKSAFLEIKWKLQFFKFS